MIWSGSSDLFARIVNADGTLTPEILGIVADRVYDAYSPRIVYNTDSDESFVVWLDNRNPGELDMFGQRIACVGACCDAAENCSNSQIGFCSGYFNESLNCEEIACSGYWCDTALPIGCGETQRNAMQGVSRVTTWGLTTSRTRRSGNGPPGGSGDRW